MRSGDDGVSAGEVAGLDPAPGHGRHLRRLLGRDHRRDPGAGAHPGARGESSVIVTSDPPHVADIVRKNTFIARSWT